MINKEVTRHIRTHTKHSSEDQAAVHFLENHLKSDGKINLDFAAVDKWPNTDGRFEFVPHPDISRRPEQNFFVQIKGTHQQKERDGKIVYQLKSLAFPAFIYATVSLDPGILFLVTDPDERGEERVFWKYMSTEFVHSIDYSKDSCIVEFGLDDEIKYTDESIDQFCEKLEKIVEHHSFVSNLDKRGYTRKDIQSIMEECSIRISDCIANFDIYNETRDDLSKNMLRMLKELCVAALLMNALSIKVEEMSLQLAWEYALLDIKTKYLAYFYKGLDYIGYRTPEIGQSERLMLKYYDFMWKIREMAKQKFNIDILENLEEFPRCINGLDQEYYEMIAKAVDSVEIIHPLVNVTRFYVHKKTAFYVGEDRYFELTLQLASIYATKFNRITVYTRQDVSTNYSIQIAYSDATVNLWGVGSKIKVVTDWKVSIEPSCLNKIGKVLKNSTRINSQYGEYDALMEFLTVTGMNLLDLIDLREVEFDRIITDIYKDANTKYFKEILQELRVDYSRDSMVKGRNVIRYLLLHLREELLDSVIVEKRYPKYLSDNLEISKKCYPFESNPYISNLPDTNSSDKSRRDSLIRIGNKRAFDRAFPYLKVQDETIRTGEIYFEKDTLVTDKEIKSFNSTLDSWERGEGKSLAQKDGYVYIDFYERTTLHILRYLLKLSKCERNKEQRTINQRFLKENQDLIRDEVKEQAIKNAFIKSKVLLIYGAAGTGKTTLMNYISNMLEGKRKLFLAKTHTALENLKRRVEDQENVEFKSIRSFGSSRNNGNYDAVFIDECSVIDNRNMEKIINKIGENSLLILAGDIYQLEAIEFGNWFYYTKEIILTKGAKVELSNTWRTDDQKLIELWNEVREHKPLITEKMAMDGPFSEELGANLLKKDGYKDNVVLCLNYDGKFGLNNMNNYFQCANHEGEAVVWGEWIYKKGDPILFNDSKRFPVLYNNLKGWIVEIEKNKTDIRFTIDIDMKLTEKECKENEIEFVKDTGKYTRICLEIFKYNYNVPENEIDEMRMKAVVPFQLAYAVSIHKAQGLEYDSVKIVIPDSISERVTHGVFYTAITRAKKKLKIYWSAETMTSVIEKFSKEELGSRSLDIIKKKLN